MELKKRSSFVFIVPPGCIALGGSEVAGIAKVRFADHNVFSSRGTGDRDTPVNVVWLKGDVLGHSRVSDCAAPAGLVRVGPTKYIGVTEPVSRLDFSNTKGLRPSKGPQDAAAVLVPRDDDLVVVHPDLGLVVQ